MVSTDLQTHMVSLSEIVPYPGNAKEHPEWQVDQLVSSIEKFGNCDPIAAWHNQRGQLEVVEGHGRLMALEKLGYEEAPVIFLDHLTDEQRRAYALVHNQLTMNTGFDMEILSVELDAIVDIDMTMFDFDLGSNDWFSDRQRNDTSHQEGNDEYNDFLDKFEVKKTTDDCYTPDLVYDAVLDWVRNEYGISNDTKIVRPFCPNGDYEHEDYPDGCVVVDNPPFSLMVHIIRFYTERNIPFFVFAPTLTLFSGRNLDVCYIAADCDITYENGAKVNTSFITNLDKENRVRTAPSLNAAVMEADKRNREELAKPVNLKYRYPSHVITAAMVGNWSSLGVEFSVPKESAYQIGKLDAQAQYDKAIYGSGFLLSDECARDAERAKADAERAKALEAAKALGDGVEVEPDGSVVWRLSERELAIVDGLGK